MLQKGFLKNKYSIVYSKTRIFKRVLAGVLGSLFIYSFLCGLRLLFRSMEFGYSNGPYLLNETSRYWQNFNFALIAFAVGNTGFISTFFKRPSALKLPNYKRSSILVDQIYLPYNFAHLFFKVFFMMSFMSMMALNLSVFEISTYLFVLISVVLFLESYKTMIRVYGIKIYKLMALNMFILVVAVFCISNTSIFNYKKIEAILLKSNPLIKLPISEYRDPTYFYNLYSLKVYKKNDEVVYNINGVAIDFDSIGKFLEDRNKLYYHLPSINLLVANDFPMKEILKVQRYLNEQKMPRIRYVLNKVSGIRDRFDMNGISRHLPPIWISEKPSENNNYSSPPYIIKENMINVRIEANGFVIVDGIKMNTRKALITFFREHINEKNTFNFMFDESSLSYQAYMDVYSRYRMVINNLRDSFLITLGRSNIEEYDPDYREVITKVKSKYPIRQIDNYVLK